MNDVKEREIAKKAIKEKLATAIRLILHGNKRKEAENRKKGIEDLHLVDSMRQLVADSGLSYTIVQTTATAKRDPSFTSFISMISSLGLSLSEFAATYDTITDAQITATLTEIKGSKRKTGTSYTARKAKTAPRKKKN